MSARARSLAANEIAVGRRGAALAGGQRVAVRAEAHRTAGVTPFESRVDEDLRQTLGLGLGLDDARAGNNPCGHAGCDLSSTKHGRGGSQVFDAPIGAGADEDPVDGDIGQRHAWLEIHVSKRAGDRIATLGRFPRRRVRNAAVNRKRVLRAIAPGHYRRDCRTRERHLPVEYRVLVGRQGPPAGQSAIPGLALGR